MTTAPLKVGVVGCGMIGQIHADGLSKLSEDGEITTVGAADPDRDAREALARNCRFEYLTEDPHEVVADPDIDAVLIASPTATHAALVVAALEAGKSILCEKPLAPDFATVQKLHDSAKGTNLTIGVGFHSRFHPIMNKLKETADRGELGRAMGYVLRDDQYWPTGDVVPGHSSWRSSREHAGGGALLEHSIHAADIVTWFFGPARRVYSINRSMFGYDVEDVAAVVVEHSSGVIGTLLTVFNGVRGREERRVEVFFEQGTVEATTDFIVGSPEDSYMLQRPDSPPERPDLEQLRTRYFAELGLARSDFLFYTYPSDRQWVRAAQRGDSASPNFDDALRAHALVEAAYLSQRLRREVEPEAELLA